MADTIVEKPSHIHSESLSWAEVVSLQEKTSTSILRAFYADFWFLWEVTRIIKWEKTHPSNLIETLETTRSQFKKLALPEVSHQEDFQKTA